MANEAGRSMEMFSKNETLKLKGVAILLLIFHHMFRTPDNIAARGINLVLLRPEQLSQIAYCCRVCVYIFCLITAYGVTLQYKKLVNKKENTLLFLLSRWLKLLSPYWFTLIFVWCAYVVYPGTDLTIAYGSGRMMIKNMLMDLLAVHDYFNNGVGMLNGVFWYMSFSVIVIGILPIIFNVCQKFGWSIIPITMLVYSFIPDALVSTCGGSYITYILVVEVGIIFAMDDVLSSLKKWFCDLLIIRKIALLVLILFFTPLSLYASWFLIPSNPFNFYGALQAVGACGCLMFVYLYVNLGAFGQILKTLGKYSGDMFLLHVMIYENFFKDVILISKNVVIQYLMVVVLALGISYMISWLKVHTKYNYVIQRVNNLIVSRIIK